MSTNPLSTYAQNVKSQDGEDGIIARIFDVIDVKNKWCLELGALNGTHHSNSWHLVNDLGWSALLIEADVTYYQKLATLYAENPNVLTVNAFVSFEGRDSLDQLCARARMPQDFDLLVLDIDGNDYHLWDSLQACAPRVVCIEFNQTIPNDVEFIQPRDMSVNQGSSLLSLTKLGEAKGYALVGTTTCNAFFVKKEDAQKFFLADGSLDALHPDTRYQTRLFQLYDGTLRMVGYDQLLWHKQPIDQERLQVLSRGRRRYPAHIDPSGTVRRLKDWVRRQPFYGLLRRLRA